MSGGPIYSKIFSFSNGNADPATELIIVFSCNIDELEFVNGVRPMDANRDYSYSIIGNTLTISDIIVDTVKVLTVIVKSSQQPTVKTANWMVDGSPKPAKQVI